MTSSSHQFYLTHRGSIPLPWRQPTEGVSLFHVPLSWCQPEQGKGGMGDSQLKSIHFSPTCSTPLYYKPGGFLGSPRLTTCWVAWLEAGDVTFSRIFNKLKRRVQRAYLELIVLLEVLRKMSCMYISWFENREYFKLTPLVIFLVLWTWCLSTLTYFSTRSFFVPVSFSKNLTYNSNNVSVRLFVA